MSNKYAYIHLTAGANDNAHFLCPEEYLDWIEDGDYQVPQGVLEFAWKDQGQDFLADNIDDFRVEFHEHMREVGWDMRADYACWAEKSIVKDTVLDIMNYVQQNNIELIKELHGNIY